MKIITLQVKTPALSHGTVIALGSFDGIHRGHTDVLLRARAAAEAEGYASAVWTFRNPPFGAPRITDNEERTELFRGLGLDYAVYCDFESVRSLSPEEFVADILCRRFYCKKAVCGYNYTFGAGGAGKPALLDRIMRANGGEAFSLPAVVYGGEAVSSTRIRRMITAGDVEGAAELLGRPYLLRGPVIKGSRIGHTIGVPTINMNFPDGHVIPASGVYITEVKIKGITRRGVSNVGVKPTVGALDIPICETHIIDDDGDYYGETAEVRFLRFRRNEMKFSGLCELRAAIEKDIAAARAY
jgi:riboflavin kinase/FMN adenylyltransferase